jgi:prolyl-tRNA editing enzyme YbaK/EbsC (Cys-tRNA(Pro) deacylase)
MTEIEEEIISSLKSVGIPYEIFEHDPVYTCPQMAKFLKTDEAHIAKSMVVRKSDGNFLLAVLPGNKKIDLRRLGVITKSAPVTLAPKKEAEEITRCSIGCVYPLGNMINLETYFDEDLLRQEFVYFNPGSHIRSVKITTRALVDLVKPTVVKFT